MIFFSSATLLASAHLTNAAFVTISAPKVGRVQTQYDATTPLSSSSLSLFPDDGYVWPSVFEEADSMIDASLLMYSFSELRSIAGDEGNSDLLVDEDKILHPPLTAAELDGVVGKNMDVLINKAEGFSALADAVDAIIERQKKYPKGQKGTSTLEYFGDNNSQTELVYGIGVDSSWKRITISFRGTNTKQDISQDLQAWFEQIPNPLYQDNKTQPKNLNVHNGFYEYLFYETTTGEQNEDGSIKSKYEIIEDRVKEVVEKYPGYKIYVTGHSLGGALCTLFAFELAASASKMNIPLPISCVSVASPYVGDQKFRKAFQLLEEQGKLRHLRLSNHKDIVTVVPFVTFTLKRFKHVGMNLKQFLEKDETPYKLSYPSPGDEWDRAWSNNFLRYLGKFSVLDQNHSPREYDKRLERSEDALRNMYLNDLYENKDFVGNDFIDRS